METLRSVAESSRSLVYQPADKGNAFLVGLPSKLNKHCNLDRQALSEPGAVSDRALISGSSALAAEDSIRCLVATVPGSDVVPRVQNGSIVYVVIGLGRCQTHIYESLVS
jgi:hypothetical protein